MGHLSDGPVRLCMAGLPGPMALEVARAALGREPRFELLPWSLSGPKASGGSVDVDGREIRLIGPDQRRTISAGDLPAGVVAVDFTTPSAAISNVQWYVERGIPFVMGTTGFDVDAARRIVEAGAVPAVIAANMAGPIVAFKAALEWAGAQFPGVLAGLDFSIEESHQAAKRDASGTARGLLPAFAALGLGAHDGSIASIRDPDEQTGRLGVPPGHLDGHAWHFYRAASRDGSLALDLSHRINGRRVYADGALAAAAFLAKVARDGGSGKVFSMLDVMRARA